MGGDIGQVNPDGSLSIIDRKKNIFKLAQGEYVAAEAIEGVLQKNPFVGQVWVYGNSFYTCLVTVIVPDKEVLMGYAKTNKLEGSFEELCKKEEVISHIFSEVQKQCKTDNLRGFEFPKKVALEGVVDEMGMGFTVENDCLTPTQKMRRPQLLTKYQSRIDEMYEALGEKKD